MRVDYKPISQQEWHHLIHNQQGSGFIGLPYQRGAGLGSIFKRIFRTILPYAKSAGESIGKTLLSTGADIATDVVSGENLKSSVKKNTRKAAANLLETAANKMKGGKLGNRKKPINRTRKRNMKQKFGILI